MFVFRFIGLEGDRFIDRDPGGPEFVMPWQDRGFRTNPLLGHEEKIGTAETAQEVFGFLVSAGIRFAARYNPYTAAASMLYSTYQIYETVDDWLQSQLPEWATDPLDLK